MFNIMPYVYGYLIVINLIGLLFMLSDKRRAKKKRWRIPEKRLFFIALAGGSLGTALGMITFRHKTRHWYFRYGMPLFLLVQIILCRYFLEIF